MDSYYTNSNTTVPTVQTTTNKSVIDTVPVIKTTSDLKQPEVQNEIRNWCSKNPYEDYIYEFIYVVEKINETNIKSSIENAECKDWCVAGSSALFQFIKVYQQHFQVKFNDFKDPNDTDIFFLNSKGPHRRQVGKTDIVHSTEKTVQELLMNFDLPCCRVATNSHFDTWISIQCLNSILTGTYYLPEYCRSTTQFMKLLNKHRKPKEAMGISTVENINQNRMAPQEALLYGRLGERISKYRTRGFSPIYRTTNYVMPWIKQRFSYSEWNMYDVENGPVMDIKFVSILCKGDYYLATLSINNFEASVNLHTDMEFDDETIQKIITNRLKKTQDEILKNLHAFMVLQPIKLLSL